MKKLLLFAAIVVSVFISADSYAQAGSLGLGIRLTPDGGGFTAKYFVDNYFALEGQINGGADLGLPGYRGNSFAVVALAEGHIPLPDPSFRLIFGGGIHFGFWDDYYYDYNYYNNYNDYRSRGIFGFDAMVGVEYNFKEIPLGLSADIKPAFNVAPEVNFFGHNFIGFAARYYFGRRMLHNPNHNMPPHRPMPPRPRRRYDD